jgi:hypothetical protein
VTIHTNDTTCPICHEQPETIEHALLQCQRTLKLTHNIPDLLTLTPNYTPLPNDPLWTIMHYLLLLETRWATRNKIMHSPPNVNNSKFLAQHMYYQLYLMMYAPSAKR